MGYKMKSRYTKLICNFKLRNIEVEYFETLEEAKKEILMLIPISATVGVGHSATLDVMNISKELSKRGNVVFDKELAKN